MKRWLVPVICLFLFALNGLSAQEEKKDEKSYIEMDIRTSSLMELAAWCRELGLSEGGAREELASRLRSHYGVTASGTSQANQKIITIESAKTTEYFTLEAVDEEYARLKGDVIVSLKDGNAVHRIKAWEILYNRTRNVITASGKVEYVKEEGDSRETFRGESITVNLDTWASIFMDGASEKSKAGVSAAYRFAGTVISRNDEEVTVLTGAEITNAGNKESFWSLHASKLWLLPGNDWAILNAVLKIGNVPVLYLPAFYYPSDEIVFHPVLGRRTREGTFLQSTTYLLGRPKTNLVSENSITKIFGSASDDAGRTREGVFIRSSGEKKRDPASAMLKLILDAYTNLGFYAGTEWELPNKGFLQELKLDAGIGFTRDIFEGTSGYTPILNILGRKSQWNTDSDFFGLKSPLRFRLKTSGAMQLKYGTFRWVLPYYSDPYVDRDFTRRTELLDWFSMLRDRGTEEQDTSILNPLSSYDWRLSGSVSPRVSALAPYINSLSVSSISSGLTFGSRVSEKYRKFYTSQGIFQPYAPNPGESFFYPNQLTIASLSASVSGTPLTLGASAKKQARTSEAPPGDLLLPDLPVSPWKDAEGESDETSAAAKQGEYAYTIPALAQKFDLPTVNGATFSITYSLSPSASSEMKFDSSPWKEQKSYIDEFSNKVEGIDWGMSHILSSLSSSGNIGFGLNHSAYNASLKILGDALFRRYYLNEDSSDYTTSGVPDPVKQGNARDQADKDTYFNSTWDLSGSVRPFFQNSVWSNTSLSYTLRGLLAKNSVVNGDRTWNTMDWDKEKISAHQASATIDANVMDYRQTLSITTELPPRDSSITANATFRAWISTTNIRTSMQNIWSWEDEIIFKPVTITESLRFSNWGSFSGTMEFDPDRTTVDKEGLTRLTADLILWGFSAGFSATFAKPYIFNSGSTGQPWELGPKEEFAPRDLRFAYRKEIKKEGLWRNRLSFSVNFNTSLAFDLQRYTNSKFSFSLGLNVKITNFLSIQLSTASENNVIYRYRFFQGMFSVLGMKTPSGLDYGGKEDRFFIDLFKSFNFFNENDRRSSGFKLKELNLSIIHHLGDWNAQLSVIMKPQLNKNSSKYEFRSEISFLIQWVPIEEMRTEISYKDEMLSVK